MKTTSADSRTTGNPLMWKSVALFRNQLEDEISEEAEAPRYLNASPRYSLRVPIMRALMAGPMTAVELRAVVLRRAGLNTHSARIVNLHAWALKDLSRDGIIRSVQREGKKFYSLPSDIRTIIGVHDMLREHAVLEAAQPQHLARARSAARAPVPARQEAAKKAWATRRRNARAAAEAQS